MKTVDILTEGRNRVAHAWTKGDYVAKNGAVCMLGGIGYRDDGETLKRGPKRAAEYLVSACIQVNGAGSLREDGYLVGGNMSGNPYQDGYLDIANWQDAPNRKKAEVLEVYDVAIKNAKRRHING